MPTFLDRYEHELLKANDRITEDPSLANTAPPRRRLRAHRGLVAFTTLLVVGTAVAAAATNGGFAALDRPAKPSDSLREDPQQARNLRAGMPVKPGSLRVLERTAAGTISLVQRTDGKICLHILHPGGTAGAACADRARFEQQGMAVGSQARWSAWCPTGLMRSPSSSQTAARSPAR